MGYKVGAKERHKIKILEILHASETPLVSKDDLIRDSKLSSELVVNIVDVLSADGYVKKQGGLGVQNFSFVQITESGKKFLNDHEGTLNWVISKINKLNSLITFIIAVIGAVLGILHFFI